MQVSGDRAGAEGRWVRWRETDNVRSWVKVQEQNAQNMLMDSVLENVRIENRKSRMVQVFYVNNQEGGGSTAELGDWMQGWADSPTSDFGHVDLEALLSFFLIREDQEQGFWWWCLGFFPDSEGSAQVWLRGQSSVSCVCPAGAQTARAALTIPNAEPVIRFANFLGLNITREGIPWRSSG